MRKRNLNFPDSGPDKFCLMCLSLLRSLQGKPAIMSTKSTSVCEDKICLTSFSVMLLTSPNW